MIIDKYFQTCVDKAVIKTGKNYFCTQTLIQRITYEMIIWAGYGFIVAIIVFLNSLLAELISESIFHKDEFYQKNFIPLGISFIVSGIIIYYLKKYLDKKKANDEGTRVFDNVTISKVGHHLFFIPFKYWSYIMMVLGIVVMISQLISLIRNK